MMRLFNQTKNVLRWQIAGKAFECEPWGIVEIDDALGKASVARGVPLGVSPVAPETRAQQRVVDGQDEQRDQALRGLRKQAEEARAELEIARRERDDAQLALSEERGRARKGEAERAKLLELVESLKADKQAAETLLTEQAKIATDAEERALKAETRMTELQKLVQQPPEKKQKSGRAE